MKRILIAFLGIVLAALIGYSIYYMQTTPNGQKLAGIDIIMHSTKGIEPFMGEEDVRGEMARKGLNLKGVLLDSIDVAMVERKLGENPLFSDVEVYITPGSKRMKVEVHQKEALFLVQTPKRSYYVSTERGIIPMNPQYAVYVPVVTGAVTEELAKSDIFTLVSTLREDNYFRHYFGQIHLDEVEGIILSPRVGTTSVILGKSKDYKTMLAKYQTFVREVFPRTGDEAYDYVKLAYRDQVVARPHNWSAVADSLAAVSEH